MDSLLIVEHIEAEPQICTLTDTPSELSDNQLALVGGGIADLINA